MTRWLAAEVVPAERMEGVDAGAVVEAVQASWMGGRSDAARRRDALSEAEGGRGGARRRGHGKNPRV
jgi:hypothetical protein